MILRKYLYVIYIRLRGRLSPCLSRIKRRATIGDTKMEVIDWFEEQLDSYENPTIFLILWISSFTNWIIIRPLKFCYLHLSINMLTIHGCIDDVIHRAGYGQCASTRQMRDYVYTKPTVHALPGEFTRIYQALLWMRMEDGLIEPDRL